MLGNNSNLKKYKLTQKQIAKYLDYSSTQAFYNSSARDRILLGIERIIKHIEQQKKG